MVAIVAGTAAGKSRVRSDGQKNPPGEPVFLFPELLVSLWKTGHDRFYEKPSYVNHLVKNIPASSKEFETMSRFYPHSVGL